MTNLCSIFDSNKRMVCLFWSPTKTIKFLKCPIYIKSVGNISYDFCPKVNCL